MGHSTTCDPITLLTMDANLKHVILRPTGAYLWILKLN